MKKNWTEKGARDASLAYPLSRSANDKDYFNIKKPQNHVDQNKLFELTWYKYRRLNQTQMEQGIPAMSYAKLVRVSKMAEQQEKCTKSIVIS